MNRQQMLGGVITGAGGALIANVLLFGGLFMDGSAEVAMFIAAGIELLVSLVSVDPGQHVRVPFTDSVRKIHDALESLEPYTAGMTAEIET